jgi:GNAT superfamily N-acetyltransferase
MKIGWGRVYIGDFVREIVLPEHAAFIYDTFVQQQYRGLGIAPHLIAGAVRCARACTTQGPAIIRGAL